MSLTCFHIFVVLGWYNVKVFCKAELDTREKAQAEDRAVQEVPQRAGMLEALRDEFPNIQFSAK
jgi:hypothetical protein